MAKTRTAIRPGLGLWTRIRLYFIIWSIKLTVSFYTLAKRRRLLLQNKIGPTYTKRYDALPQIECRIFIPETWKAGDKPLPLIIDIHGGGFTIGEPVLDDAANASFAHKHGIAVAAIGYRLAPFHKFPSLPRDCAALIQAVLADDDLPVDRSRVALAGSSAGGNLALAACQLIPDVQSQIKACVAVYPAVDFVSTVQEKMKTRVPNGKQDPLEVSGVAFDFAYVPTGTDRYDPLLSPRYAPRHLLPKHIYFLGCEHDVLCNEAKEMAEELAEQEPDGRVMYADGTGWRKGAVRWELIKGEVHGFDQLLKFGKVATRREVRGQKMYEDIANWLKEEVF